MPDLRAFTVLGRSVGGAAGDLLEFKFPKAITAESFAEAARLYVEQEWSGDLLADLDKSILLAVVESRESMASIQRPVSEVKILRYDPPKTVEGTFTLQTAPIDAV